MRSPIPPAPRRHQKDAVPPFRLAVFVLAGCLAGLGTAVWRERKGEPPCAGGDVPAGDFEVQRVQLLDKIHEWDRRAIAAGLEPILPLPGSGGCAPARAELMSDSGAISCPGAPREGARFLSSVVPLCAGCDSQRPIWAPPRPRSRRHPPRDHTTRHCLARPGGSHQESRHKQRGDVGAGKRRDDMQKHNHLLVGRG